MNKQKEAINVIRSIMRLDGRTQVWNNLYQNCRTIKCYRDPNVEKDMWLQSLIHHALTSFSIPHHFKLTFARKGHQNDRGGFIVRLPS